MTYSANDRSISNGAPIECYEFVSSFKTWRFTSYHETINVNGEDYSRLPMTRTAIDTSSIIDSLVTMDFTFPSTEELAQVFCFTENPKELTVTVYRVHEGDDYSTEFRVEWIGEISGASATGKWATIKTASLLQNKLNNNLSSVYYQRSCNHVLYDERCKAVKATYTVSAVVTKVQGQIITVDDMVQPDDELIAGEMKNTRTGEIQTIVTNEDNKLRVGYKFFDIVIGDTVELSLGCDHARLGDCKVRFNNVDNYGGFDFIPESTLFEKLKYTVTTDTVTRIRELERDQYIAQPGVSGSST